MTRINHFIHNRGIQSTLVRYMSVGVIATLLDLLIFSTLHFSFGLPMVEANTISYGVGSVNSFSLHRAWTYADRPRGKLWVQFIQFLAVALGALLITDLVIYLAPQTSLLANLPDNGGLLVKACASGAGISWNFLINYFWTFRRIAG